MFLIRLIIFGLFFYLVYFVVKKLFGSNQSPQSGSGNANDSYRSQREGDVSITYDPRNSKSSAKDVGDYVDYEEVKNSKKSE